MNLKESFRYQKYLDNLMCAAEVRMSDHENYVKRTNNHLMSKANSEAEDVVEEVAFDRAIPANIIFELMKRLTEEKENVSKAISAAKASAPIDIDAAISTNTYRRKLAKCALHASNNKPKDQIRKGTGYKFNAEGTQVAYYYDIEVKEEELFDRLSLLKETKRLAKEADEISSQIDAVLINTIVGINPMFDVNDSFDDVIESMVASISL